MADRSGRWLNNVVPSAWDRSWRWGCAKVGWLDTGRDDFHVVPLFLPLAEKVWDDVEVVPTGARGRAMGGVPCQGICRTYGA